LVRSTRNKTQTARRDKPIGPGLVKATRKKLKTTPEVIYKLTGKDYYEDHELYTECHIGNNVGEKNCLIYKIPEECGDDHLCTHIHTFMKQFIMPAVHFRKENFQTFIEGRDGARTTLFQVQYPFGDKYIKFKLIGLSLSGNMEDGGTRLPVLWYKISGQSNKHLNKMRSQANRIVYVRLPFMRAYSLLSIAQLREFDLNQDVLETDLLDVLSLDEYMDDLKINTTDDFQNLFANDIDDRLIPIEDHMLFNMDNMDSEDDLRLREIQTEMDNMDSDHMDSEDDLFLREIQTEMDSDHMDSDNDLRLREIKIEMDNMDSDQMDSDYDLRLRELQIEMDNMDSDHIDSDHELLLREINTEMDNMNSDHMDSDHMDSDHDLLREIQTEMDNMET
jgi:hypothetical protein